MKKVIRNALFLILVLTVALAFVACKGNEDAECEHSYGEWSVTEPATCTEKGLKTRICTLCQNEETEEIDAIGHNVSNCVCANCGMTTHTVGDDCVCTVCGVVDHAAKVSKDGYCKHDEDIYFGSYPQTKITGDNLTATLTRMAGALPSSDDAQGWTGYNYYLEGKAESYMWYIDKEYGGTRYRGVYFSFYRPTLCSDSGEREHSEQGNNGYSAGRVYWFKFEPIKWSVLEVRSGTTLLLAELAVDSQSYYHSEKTNDSNKTANNYAESEIRKWLNETFYNTAFNAVQKELIQTTAVANGAESTGDEDNEYACADTNDNVFLLSFEEITQSAYGFSSNEKLEDEARCAQSSDYAKSQGCWNSSKNGNNYCYWWTRSPESDDEYEVRVLSSSGHAKLSNSVEDTSIGVRPAVRVKLS